MFLAPLALSSVPGKNERFCAKMELFYEFSFLHTRVTRIHTGESPGLIISTQLHYWSYLRKIVCIHTRICLYKKITRDEKVRIEVEKRRKEKHLLQKQPLLLTTGKMAPATNQQMIQNFKSVHGRFSF